MVAVMNVLILGTEISFKTVDYKRLTTLGINCFLLCKNKLDFLEDIPCIYSEEITKKSLEDTIVKYNIDRVVSFNEMDIELVGLVRDKTNIKGIGYKESLKFRDKDLMVSLVSPLVKVPKTVKLRRHDEYNDLITKLESTKIIIKPINQQGTQNVTLITNSYDYESLVSNMNSNLEYIAQEYIDSAVYHSETIVENGIIKFCSARKYSITYLEYMKNKNVIFSLPIFNGVVIEKIKLFMEKIVQGLDVKNACMHTEFFLNGSGDGDPIFIETCIRQAGMGINETHWKTLNVSLTTCMVLLECGIKLPEIKQENIGICGWFSYPSGVVEKVEEIDIPVDNLTKILVKEGTSYPAASKIRPGISFVAWSNSKIEIEKVYTHLKNKNPIIMKEKEGIL